MNSGNPGQGQLLVFDIPQVAYFLDYYATRLNEGGWVEFLYRGRKYRINCDMIPKKEVHIPDLPIKDVLNADDGGLILEFDDGERKPI